MTGHDTPASEMPAGPWVWVIGMHRSGTSVATGILHELGLGVPEGDDLMIGRDDNPNHFESWALMTVADRLLAALGGSWTSPPALEPGWEASGPVRALDADAATATTTAFPTPGPLAFKDPRACLLIPYWRRLLPTPAGILFLWRDPDAVAASLTRRNGLSARFGLALWERYNREALAALGGLDVLVTEYGEMLADPMAYSSETARWLEGLEGLGGLEGLEGPTSVARVDAAAATVKGGFDHTGPRSGRNEDVAGLTDALAGLRGHHPRFVPPDLGAEPGWVAEELARHVGEAHAHQLGVER